MVENEIEKYIHLSKYARWIDGKKCRENWGESVQRYVDFWAGRLSDICDRGSFKSVLYDVIYNKKVMPSMRAFMTAGKALERDHAAGYNPVTGDTKVVVKNLGNIPIKYLSGEEHEVLNKNGEWTKAFFKHYGRQDIFEVTVKLNSNTVRDVTCTGNHRWVLQNGRVVDTNSLREGDRINFVSAPKPSIDTDYILGVRHGIIYGDGTATRACKRVKGYHVRLCGASSELLSFFDGYPVCYPSSYNGDPVVMLYDDFAATHDLKSLPSNGETDSYLLGFIRGWLSADGSVSKNSQVSLCVSSVGKEWLSSFSERLGFVIQRITEQPAVTNYGKRNSGSYVIYFSRSSLVADDFLCSWKKANFRPLRSHYVVSSVEPLQYATDVYCAEVPDTNTFVLEGGLVTGNCCFVVLDNPVVFAEALYISMCGCGVGFSVERQFVQKMPQVPEELHDTETVLVVRDSRIGWATALNELVHMLYAGSIPKWDVSKLRPKGAKLKTFGGRSSGPEPLVKLFKFVIKTFKSALGRRLTSIECHDIMCMVLECVVSGGVRRSAGLSLSNLTDDRMRRAKYGDWWLHNPQRAMANNSVAYTEKPDLAAFLAEWVNLYESKSGERGIVNREALWNTMPERRKELGKHEFGVNPCAEIVLRPFQFCNLTEVVIRPEDTLEDLKLKVEWATIIGVFQSTLTDFRFLRKIYKKNCEEERLLGVSLTGIMDHPVLSNTEDVTMIKDWLQELKEHAKDICETWAKALGINVPTACTTVKPSGTVSQLCSTASGIHPRYSEFYIRRYIQDEKDPLTQLMVNEGVPYCVMENGNYLFSFPVQSPKNSLTKDSVSALMQLELWKLYRTYWCEHNVSQTIYYKDEDFLKVGAWVYENFDILSGVSFFPGDDHIYDNAPYEAISEDVYNDLKNKFPERIRWERLAKYEKEDTTQINREIACSGGACEL